MPELTLLLVSAAVALGLGRLTGIPPIPLLVAAGLVLGSAARPPAEILDTALILGVSFLIFALGMELDPRRIRVQRRAAVLVGAVQFAVLALAGFGAARGLGFAAGEAAFVALALPASSTLVCVRILQRRRQMYEPFGRLVLGVLLIQDALVILLLPVVMEAPTDPGILLSRLASVVLLGLLAWSTWRWMTPLFRRIAEERETVLLCALAVLFAFLGAASLLDLPPVVGGFLAGVALARFPVNGQVRVELAPLRDFFAAVFFVALGAIIRLPTGVELLQAGVLVGVVLLVTPPLVALVAERSGFTSRSALESGLLLAQTSEISLVIGLTGMLAGSIGESLFVVLALSAVATMALTPLLSTDESTQILLRIFRRRDRGPEPQAPEGHVVVVGAGSSGMPLVEDLLLSGTPVAVVDHDPAVVSDLRAAGIHAVRGDVTDLDTLAAAGLPEARAVCSTARRVRDNASLLRVSRGIPVLIRVFEEEEARWVRDRGGEPLLYAEAAAEELFRWFQRESSQET